MTSLYSVCYPHDYSVRDIRATVCLLIVIPCLTFKLFALPVCQRGDRTTSEFEMHSFPFPLVTVIDDNMQEVKPRSLGNIVVR